MYVFIYIYINKDIYIRYIIYITTSHSFCLLATLLYFPFLCFSLGCILGNVFSLSSIHGFNSLFGFA